MAAVAPWDFSDSGATFDNPGYTFDGGVPATASGGVSPQALFGPGILWVTRTDVANATPINIGFVNEFSVDISFDVKSFYGQSQYPILMARGQAKSTGKVIAGTASGRALDSMLMNGAWTTGQQYDLTTTVATAIPASPFQITPTVPFSGTFDTDLGVFNSATGQPMTKVTSTPTAGQYAVSGGVYTFSSADQLSGYSVIITFAYRYTSGASGQNQIFTNQLQGVTPTLQVDYKSTLFGMTYYLRLFAATGSKTAIQHKVSDFAMPEYDFDFFANALSQVGLISLATQA
jgi:hypothetical protein